jgi:hypothetical protein
MPRCARFLALLLLFPVSALSQGSTSDSRHSLPLSATMPDLIMVPVPTGTFRMGIDWENDLRNPHRGRGIFQAELPSIRLYCPVFS